ncbi:ABC-2 type transport system permease protein [Nocardia amikacinitolerans]|uniref:ABC transporter permease subunit n=1 Tax=Nocardia amikacinitolerans TaxID=756689 RepID=UPI000ABF12A9|nr:ABC transporter permease subunit [Nocardia amikacinitolerans]MCP2317747.1 ABC-2 type transport system permease protein [Nocardia amikacinitolerans]
MTTVSTAAAPMIDRAAATAHTVVLTKTLRVNRRSLLGWTAGVTLAAVIYASFYPQMAKSGGSQTENLPEGLREALNMNDIASAPGYLGSTVFGLIVPLLAMFFGAALGARVSAADEESGTLDLLLAHPITRTSLILQRFAALVAAATGLGAVLWLAMLAIRGGADLSAVSPGQFAAQCLHLILLAVAFGALATGLGAAFGRRSVVFAVTAVVGVAAYAAHAFAGQIGLDWATYLSPFHYYIDSEPLRNGVGWSGITVLAAASITLVAAGSYRFNHRDLG